MNGKIKKRKVKNEKKVHIALHHYFELKHTGSKPSFGFALVDTDIG